MGYLCFMVSVYPAAHNGFVKVQHDLLQDLSAWFNVTAIVEDYKGKLSNLI